MGRAAEADLANFTLTLSDLAEKYGVCMWTAGHWRRAWKREKNLDRAYQRVDDAALKALHAKGKSDGEIGRILGHASGTIRHARKRLGLPPHFAPGTRRAKA